MLDSDFLFDIYTLEYYSVVTEHVALLNIYKSLAEDLHKNRIRSIVVLTVTCLLLIYCSSHRMFLSLINFFVDSWYKSPNLD